MKINENDIFRCKPWEFEENRNDKFLLIWPDLPRWIRIDVELYSLLKLLDGKNTLVTIIKKLSELVDKEHETLKNEVFQIIPALVENGLIHKKGEKSKESPKKEIKLSDVSIHVTNRCNLKCPMCANKYNEGKQVKEDYGKFSKTRSGRQYMFGICSLSV